MTKGPAAVTVRSAPTAPARSTTPRSAGPRPSASRTEGRRASQLDIMTPLSANTPRSTQRALARARASDSGPDGNCAAPPRIDSIRRTRVRFESIRGMVTSVRVRWPRVNRESRARGRQGA
ncbi:Uncharacterised protein [Mycobacteroides abscessus]|nr:Uncharacterised protein [Mycobacteroides abscessus]